MPGLADQLGDLPLRPSISKPDANYIDPGPEPYVCGNCRFYSEGRCEIVDGKIQASGACRFFAHAEDPRAHDDVEDRPQTAEVMATPRYVS